MISRVWSFTGGSVRHLERLVRADGAWSLRLLPARFAIIEHSSGIIVFDTGFHPSLRERLGGVAKAYNRVVPWRCPPEQAVGARLRSLGFDPDDVQLLVLSHMHADHVSGWVDLQNCPLALTRKAWQHLQSGGRIERGRHGYFRELLPSSLPAHTRWLDPPEPGLDLEASCEDLLGDGSIGVVALPGHAPGQVGLVLRPPSGPNILLAADATFSRDAVKAGVAPSRAFMRSVFDDVPATLATLDRIRAWMTHDPNLVLHCAHGWEGPQEGLLYES
ncbi:MAG: MBL fold metallo-hydrolase [Myxococcota bacterium]